jgi:aminotransferase
MKNIISRRVSAIPPSGIRKYFDIAAQNPKVISLAIGEPDFVTPKPILQAGIDSLLRGETAYTSNAGTLALREALSYHINHQYRVHYNPENEIVVTVGVSEAFIDLFTAICDPGDEVIVPQPCFVAYTATVALAGGVPVPVQLSVENGFQATAAAIEPYITPRTKAILIGSPSNPTGAVYTHENLLGIAQLAKKHDLIVISDEVYDQLVYGVKHVCFPSLPKMRERTVLLGGFSKDYAMTGWRVGYMCGPEVLVSAAKKVHQYIIMSAPTTGQAAALAALQIGAEHVQHMVNEYDRRRKLLVRELNNMGLSCFEPRGAFYCFPNVSASGMSGDAFADALLSEEEIALVPGSAFGESGKAHVRIAYAQSYEKIELALERMYRFMQRHG